MNLPLRAEEPAYAPVKPPLRAVVLHESPLAAILREDPFVVPAWPLPPPYRPGLRINIAGYSLYIEVTPANDLYASPGRRVRRRAIRRRNPIARMLCEHDFYYSWRRSRIICVGCGAVRKIP